ncbi:hypothetical protein ACFQ5Q_08495 [Luteolibacter ambystomatis]|nr:hypothetical protein [Luteolibacter ambystomatis]
MRPPLFRTCLRTLPGFLKSLQLPAASHSPDLTGSPAHIVRHPR